MQGCFAAGEEQNHDHPEHIGAVNIGPDQQDEGQQIKKFSSPPAVGHDIKKQRKQQKRKELRSAVVEILADIGNQSENQQRDDRVSPSAQHG